MAEAEQPERLRGGREVTVDDVRQLVASATPHFAYQIRNRIRTLITPLPTDSPVRLYGEAEIAKLQSLGFTGEVRGTPEQPGMRELPSVNETEQPRYLKERDRRLARLLAPRAARLVGAPRRGGAQRRPDDPARPPARRRGPRGPAAFLRARAAGGKSPRSHHAHRSALSGRRPRG